MSDKNTKLNKKKNQHIVARTYLKYWKIAPDKSFVYGIDFLNKYNDKVQLFGLNHAVFIRHKYYNHNSFENPQIIEDILGREIEPDYDKIMTEINSELNLTENTRIKIINWLYFSKMRSPYIRDDNSRIANFLYKTVRQLQKGKLDEEEEMFYDNYSKDIGKEGQIRALTNPKIIEEGLNLYFNTLNNKRWKILKSLPNYTFWTNDNPGFSPNTFERFALETPYHSIMEMNERSIIYYPLSPKYCLQCIPFEDNIPYEITGLSMDIKYEQASGQLIHYINCGTFATRRKLIISNNKEILEYSIQKRIRKK